jgi:disulfide bond formation protein DsbB
MAVSRTMAFVLALLVPLGLMAGALIAQFRFGLPPCELCWWQRYPHIAAIGIALLALALRKAPAGIPLVVLAALAIGTSGLIGAFHAGVEYGWWEGLSACSSSKLGNDPLAAIMNAPLVRCDTAPWTLLGISMAGFNFMISIGDAIIVLALIGRGKRKAFS